MIKVAGIKVNPCLVKRTPDHRAMERPWMMFFVWDIPSMDVVAEGSMIQTLTSNAACIVTFKMFRKQMQWVRLFHGLFCNMCTWTVKQTSSDWALLWPFYSLGVLNTVPPFVFLRLSELSNYSTCYTSLLYLAGVPAVKLWWHLSNMIVIPRTNMTFRESVSYGGRDNMLAIL